MDSLKLKMFARRRPKNQPPSRHDKKPAWRARKASLWLPSRRQIVITIRKFRTNPARDSKHYKQLIIELQDSSIREISVAIKSRPKTRKPSRQLFFNLPVKATAATALILIGVFGAIFSATHLQKPVSFDISPSRQVKALAPAATKTLPASLPTHLDIPKIGVSTDLSQVGLQANGQIEMPWDITTASWYKYSPTPGQVGPAVIVGHLDGANYANMAGVFYRLRELTPGDQFAVTRQDGSVATFKVLYLKQVSQANFPTNEIYGNINYAGIRLITCGGTFDTNSNHYTDNTVVFGALE